MQVSDVKSAIADKKNVVFLIDTSGSMETKNFEFVYPLFKDIFPINSVVEHITCDSCLTGRWLIDRSKGEFNAHTTHTSGGGSDFERAFEILSAEYPFGTPILVYTDGGFSPFPIPRGIDPLSIFWLIVNGGAPHVSDCMEGHVVDLDQEIKSFLVDKVQ